LEEKGALIESLRGCATPHHRAMFKLHLDFIAALDAALAEVDNDDRDLSSSARGKL
jgi:hypothetical protein